MPNDTEPPAGPRRARSFGSAAADYHAYRPGYPDDAVDTALHGARRDRVLDLGAGTGKLTASLVGRAHEVLAVEPDPEMLAVLRDALPGVDARAGTAESIPLPDASVDAVLVGQALHWFDLDAAVPELARVLRPGGVLAGLWNMGDHDVEWVRGAAEVLVDGDPMPFRPDLDPEAGLLPAGPHFAAEERIVRRWRRPSGTEAMLDEIRTHSRFLTGSPERRERILRRTRDYLDGRPETASGAFDVPMRTVVWRTLRR